MSKQSKQRREPWRNAERHYCQVCNAWMGSDRQSIAIHENGKKHKENVERAALEKRQERASSEQQAKALQDSLQAIESAALQSHADDLGLFGAAQPATATAPPVVTSAVPSPIAPTTSASSAVIPPVAPTSSGNKKQERDSWQSKKKQREEKRGKRKGGDDDDDEDDEAAQEASGGSIRKKRKISPDEGHYTYEEKTYLEGVVFGDMLEEEMPLEIWTGNLLARRAEKKLPERHAYWKSGIAAAVRKRPSAVDHEDRLVVDIAYLREMTDTEETLDRSVPLNRIRIVLGADDSMVPDTLEEARIMAMGGEEEEVVQDAKPEEMDEATGLSSWSTVSVKKTTVQQELKEERERLRQKRREATEEAERVKREADRRKMEEAKVANADDSALGAYDVWSRSKEGYKGVDIHGEAQVQVHEFGKKLSDGKNAVGFKKTAFKAKKKKQNRRITSADDD